MKSNIKILIIFLIINCQLSINNYAQVGINNDGSNPDASAMMDIKSTDKGMALVYFKSMVLKGLNPKNASDKAYGS